MGEPEGKTSEISLKDQGNEFFKAGNYLKAAALYTQAIKKDPSNPTLYSNRAAAFLHLVKLNKALTDADTTISLKPDWEKGYFRKGCILEAMERYEDALAAFQVALKYNPQSSESGKYGAEDCWKEIFSFLVETMESAVKSWHGTSTVDPRAYFLLNKEKQTPKNMLQLLISIRWQYAEDSFSQAACLVAPKSIISYPQVWKGLGSRKWKHGQTDGFFFQFESPSVRKIWFVPSSSEKGQTLCRRHRYMHEPCSLSWMKIHQRTQAADMEIVVRSRTDTIRSGDFVGNILAWVYNQSPRSV
ncbi:hypothetical protein DH2020_036044 [Rehmannia glutinosa]|uniref:Uncharacterized protein n=1 Tax=Rehmannia glutinosa TaxID=99300 RepID=A0ABR0V7K7_REHGL